MKKKILLISICVVVFLTILVRVFALDIRGKVFQLYLESGSTKPATILKTIGVKKIKKIKREYNSDTLKIWNIVIDGNRKIELEVFKSYDGYRWSIMGDSYKKINEIDSTIGVDYYAHYYSNTYEYVTNLEENKIIKQSEVENNVAKSSLNPFEFLSGLDYYLIPICLIGGLITLIIIAANKNSKKKQQEYEQFLKDNESTYAVMNICYISGVDTFIQYNSCNIFIQDKKIKITNLVNKNEVSIAYNKINACGCYTETEIQQNIITKNGSVIGRGILGGMVFGPAGLILGGMSAIGSEEKTVKTINNTYYFIINYKSKSTSKAETILFKYDSNRRDIMELSNMINERLKNTKIDL